MALGTREAIGPLPRTFVGVVNGVETQLFTINADGTFTYHTAVNMDVILSAVLSIAEGGTGQITSVAAFDALAALGDDIASATTTNLATATGPVVDVTGTTTITALGTAASGTLRLVRFTGALTLTHNGTTLILPGAGSIITVAGDFALFRSLGSGNWACVHYIRSSTVPYYASGSTWTPTLTCDTPGNLNIVYSTRAGFYKRVGPLAWVSWHIITSTFTHSSASDTVRITGLPFSSDNVANQHAWGATQWSGVTKANFTQISARLIANTNAIDFVIQGSAQAGAGLAITDLPTGGSVVLSGSLVYPVAPP